LQGYIAGGARFTGLFQVAWDRLRECDIDVSLRQEPTEANARALLWTAERCLAEHTCGGELDLECEACMVDAEREPFPAWDGVE
jgi:hypothetical protein